MSRKTAGKGNEATSGEGRKGADKTGTRRETKQNRWRRIEALRERRALRDALEDVLGDDFDIDDTIFGISPEDERYFIKPAPAPEDTAFDDGDDDDFDDSDEDLDEDLDDDFDEDEEESEDDAPEEDEER